MQIRTALDSDNARISEINSQSIPDGSFVEPLLTCGKLLPALTFVAEDDGAVIGFIAFCEAEVEGTRQLLLAGVCVAPEHRGHGAGLMLVNYAHEAARELSYGWSLAFDDTEYLQKKAGYVLAAKMGFIPPDVIRDFKRIKAFRISPDAPELCGFPKLPTELGMKEATELLRIKSSMNPEQLRCAIYTTRRRERIFRIVMLLLASLAALAVAKFFDMPRFRQGSLLALFIAIKNVITPISTTRKAMKQHVEKYGAGDTHSICIFTDIGVVRYLPEYNGVSVDEYDKIKFLYLKKEHLFLSDDERRGIFIMYKDIPELDYFIMFIKCKCPKIRIRK